jgi:hypothetical protein
MPLLLFDRILLILRRLLSLCLLTILLSSYHVPPFYILFDGSVLSHQRLMPPQPLLFLLHLSLHLQC